MSIVVATGFPQKVIDELDEVARERRRTRAEIIREAVAMYLSEWADYAIALDRRNDPNDPVVGADDFRREVDEEAA
ncbi:MAG: ribbon-helix-helix protein, CopG family [Actinobacteria bacterium]|nr:ribbon-helix-helix protein, CopG family [Actinomycetota bacterium]